MSINNSPLWNKGLQSSGDLMTDTLGQMTQQQSNFNPNALSANEPAQPAQPVTPTTPDTTDTTNTQQQQQNTGPSPACQAAKKAVINAQFELQKAQLKMQQQTVQSMKDWYQRQVNLMQRKLLDAQHKAAMACGGM